MPGEVGIPDEGTDPDPTLRQHVDPVEPGQPGHVDEAARPGGARLHQVEQVRACGEVGGSGLGSGGDRLGHRGGADVVEAVHAILRSAAAISLWASRTASVMPA